MTISAKRPKPAVARFYEEQGKLCDLQAALEKAWAEYQTASEIFSSRLARQDTSPAVYSQRLRYFGTDITLSAREDLSENTVEKTTVCAAFDRETRACVPLPALFQRPEGDIGKNLPDLAEKNGAGPADSVVKQEMAAAFRTEYLSFGQDSLTLTFPKGTIPSQEYTDLVSINFTDDCKALFRP